MINTDVDSIMVWWRCVFVAAPAEEVKSSGWHSSPCSSLSSGFIWIIVLTVLIIITFTFFLNSGNFLWILLKAKSYIFHHLWKPQLRCPGLRCIELGSQRDIIPELFIRLLWPSSSSPLLSSWTYLISSLVSILLKEAFHPSALSSS